MGIELGEIFVNLVLKNGKAAKKEVSGVKDEMVSLSKSGLVAITAITGVSFGLKSLYDNALNAGKTITNFGNFTQLSTVELQKWQYVAKQAGSTAESMAGSIQGMQAAMGEMSRSGPTQEFQYFADAVNLDYTKAKDTFYMMQKAMEFAKSDAFDVTARHRILGSMGISQSDIGAMMASKIGPDQVPKGMIRSEGHTKAFANAGIQFQNIQDKMQMQFEKVIIKLMPSLSKALNELTPLLTTLGEVVGVLTIKMMHGIAALAGNDWEDTWNGIKEIFSDKSGAKFLSGFGVNFIPTAAQDKWLQEGLERSRGAKVNKENSSTKNINIINNNTFNGVNDKTSKGAVKGIVDGVTKNIKNNRVN